MFSVYWVEMRRLPRLSEVPTLLSETEFWELLGEIEHERLDFKRSPDHITEAIAAMAMTDGGLLVVGVSDDRKLTGRKLDQKTLDKVMRSGQSCGVIPQTVEVQVDGVPVTLVAVPEVRGRIVTTPDGRLLRRVGSDNQPLVGDALGRFVREREERSAEEQPVRQHDLADFDLELVNRALTGDGRTGPRVVRRSLLRALIDLGVANAAEPPLDPQVHEAAVLLFANEPSRYIPGAAVQVVRRVGVGPGPGPASARAEIAGPLPTLLDDTLRFIDRHTTRQEAVVGTRREPFAEYPPAVLREAVLNALAHRDYGLAGATVDVTIWDDRIEVRSPGPLPGHITVTNMRDEHYSRNRHVMKVLRLLNLVEEYGEGVDRMFHEMEARLMEPPSFAATPSSVTVTFYNRSLLSIEDQAWLALLGHLELSAAERRVLVVAKHERAVTPRRLRLALGDEADVDALLGSVAAKGLLIRTGRGGGARYVLSDEIVLRAGEGGVEARGRKRQMLLDEVIRRDSLSTAEAVAFLGEEDRQLARRLLDDLVRSRDVVPLGRTRARRYYSANSRQGQAALKGHSPR